MCFPFLHLLHYSVFLTELQVCAITGGIKRYKSIIKEKKKKHDKIVLLGKTKSDTVEALISKALINLYISRDECFSVNHVLRKHNEIKEEIKNSETSAEYTT